MKNIHTNNFSLGMYFTFAHLFVTLRTINQFFSRDRGLFILIQFNQRIFRFCLIDQTYDVSLRIITRIQKSIVIYFGY